MHIWPCYFSACPYWNCCCCCALQANELAVCLSKNSGSCISRLDLGRGVWHRSCFVVLRYLMYNCLWHPIWCLHWGFLKMKTACLFNLDFLSWRSLCRRLCNLNTWHASVIFLFIGVHHSKYLKWHLIEADTAGKECASLLTVVMWCLGFSYFKLDETYQTQDLFTGDQCHIVVSERTSTFPWF